MPPQPAPPVHRPAAVVVGIGLTGGLISGLVGVGGGIVMVPLMVAVLAMIQHRAHGTSLAMIVPIAISASIPYWIANGMEWLVVVSLAGTSVIFAAVGARLTAYLNATVLKRSFAILLTLTAVRLFISAQSAAMFGEMEGIQLITAALIAGTATGLIAGTMGVGGGIVMVPAMVIVMGVDQHVAQGISLAVIVPTALSGAAQHFRLGNVDLRWAAYIAAGGIVGGAVGAQFAQFIPAFGLRVLFAVFALYSAQRMIGFQGWLVDRVRAARASES